LKKRFVLPVLGLLASAALSHAPVVRADTVDKATCLDAVSKGQRLRDTHQLVEAREKFRVCARAECPAVVQSDCAGWLADVEKTLPTVVLSAKDHGRRDVVDVRVSVDGQTIASTLDGQAVAVNPGLRTFRFERAADGRTATSQLLIKEGEKARGVAVVLSGDEVAGTPGEPGPASDGSAGGSRTPAPSQSRTTVRLLGLLIGGAGVVGMAASAGVAVDAKSKDNRAANEPGTLRQTDSTSAVNEGNVATVLLGVGAAMAVAGVVLWIAAPSGKTSSASASVPPPARDLVMGTDGRRVFLSGSF
jgi:hypothetical protein